MKAKDENEPLLLADSNERKIGRYDSLSFNGSGGKVTAIPMEAKSKLGDLTLNSLSNGSHEDDGNSSPDIPLLSQTEDVTFAWRDVNVHVEQPKGCTDSLRNWLTCKRSSSHVPRVHILKSVTGVAYPGELLAIMGASGSGKTTLLNALTFRTNRKLVTSGRVSVNGEPVNDNILTSISAYVQQDDLFIGTLTVKEHLIFQALVRMDKRLSYESRMRRVEEVMAELTLTKCQNTVIGIPGKLKGISGGEMKRLSFASEVLTNPPLMFCDEPTSGLDSFMAQNVVTVLKNLASRGKTIVTTIHQPSSEVYNMFDKIILMAAGRLAFLGTPAQANNFFKTLGAPCPVNHNPADHFIHLLAVVPSREETCRNMIGLVCDSYRTSPIGVEMTYKAETFTEKTHSKWYNKRRVSPYKASWCTQFRALLWRSWLSIMKEPELIKGRLFQTVMVAAIIGILYFGQDIDQDGVMNINGALFVCLSNMTFQNMFSVIHVFCSELPVFLREHLSGMYRTDVYFLTKTMAEVPIFIAIPVLFTGIIYFMIGLNPSFFKFIISMAIMVLVSNAASSFGYFISSISSNISVALSIGPPIVIPFLLFGGFLLNAGSVPPYLKWLSDLSWFKYGNEALLINQWEDITNITCTRGNATCPADGHVVLETYNFSENDFTMDFFALIAIITGFRLLAFSGLLTRSYVGH